MFVLLFVYAITLASTIYYETAFRIIFSSRLAVLQLFCFDMIEFFFDAELCGHH